MSEMHQPAPKPTSPPTASFRSTAPSAPERTYVVDRIEGGVAAMIPDDEVFAPEDVLVRRLGCRVSEGDVVRVPVRADGSLAWNDARADPRRRAERIEQAEARLERLKKRDPGGDVILRGTPETPRRGRR